MARKVEPLDEAPNVAAVPDTTEDKASLLARLGAELAAVATDDAKATAKLNEIEAVLKGIKIEDYPSLAESPAVQAFVRMIGGDGLRPGETKNPGTVAELTREWTIRDFASFPVKTFTPNETIPLTVNGVTCYVFADQECSVPEPFYSVYQEHRRWMREGEKHKQYLLNKAAPPPDPNLLSDASARVRAYTQLGEGRYGVGLVARDTPQESADNG